MLMEVEKVFFYENEAELRFHAVETENVLSAEDKRDMIAPNCYKTQTECTYYTWIKIEMECIQF